MDETRALAAQIDTLRAELAELKRALDAQVIHEDLRNRVHVRFDVLIAKQADALHALREGLQPDRAQEGWAAFRQARRSCQQLFGEVLAFLQGVLVRSAGLDDGICQIADDLVDDLAYWSDLKWSRLTILGDAAFVANIAEIIRIPFPEFTVWKLPVIGHEFGHLVAQQLNVRDETGRTVYLFERLLDREGRGGQKERFLHEYFADVFATYAHGPAFLCMATHLRFDPSIPQLDGRDHPSAARRVHVMQQTLAQMERDGPPEYDWVCRRIHEIWNKAMVVLGVGGEGLDPASSEQLDALVDELYGLFRGELHDAQYDGWLRARRLANGLQPDGDGLPQLRDEDTLADVLNAAWLWRISVTNREIHALELGSIDRKAKQLCHQVSARRRQRSD
jgi:hypothetical protein